jgi:hypothetical protein
MQQAATRVKEKLPNTAKLTTTEWRVILTRGDHTRFRKNCVPITLVPNVLGYARRNTFQPNCIQIVCPTTEGGINSWHVPETDAESLITVSRAAPDQGAAQRVWKAGWLQSFQN